MPITFLVNNSSKSGGSKHNRLLLIWAVPLLCTGQFGSYKKQYDTCFSLIPGNFRLCCCCALMTTRSTCTLKAHKNLRVIGVRTFHVLLCMLVHHWPRQQDVSTSKCSPYTTQCVKGFGHRWEWEEGFLSIYTLWFRSTMWPFQILDIVGKTKAMWCNHACRLNSCKWSRPKLKEVQQPITETQAPE